MTIATLDTLRLRLRPVSAKDVLFLHDMVSNARVRRYLDGPTPLLRRPAQISGYLASTPPHHLWIVAERQGRRRIGMVFLTPHRDGTEIELSYQFAPKVWGQGYATEACARVLEYGQTGLGLGRVIAETQTANVGSCRLLERLGLREYDRVTRFGAEQSLYST